MRGDAGGVHSELWVYYVGQQLEPGVVGGPVKVLPPHANMARVSGTALLASLQSAAPPIAYKDASNVAMDIGLLAVFDGAPLAPFAAGGFEDTLRAAAQDNAQLLIKTLFELPVERDPEAGKLVRRALAGHTHTTDHFSHTLAPFRPSRFSRQAILPARNLTLPREKPPPEPKAPTRWEKFAAEKGIAKKGKRSRLAFDTATGEDAPRFGYKRSRDPASDWLYELKGGDAPDVDHLERRALEKQRRVVNNQMSQASNLERAAREKEGRKGAAGGASLFGFSVDGGGGSAPAGKKRPRGGEGGEGARLPVGIPSIPIAEGRADALAGPGKHPKPRPSDGMGVKKAQVAFAQVSTASMGKVRAGPVTRPSRPPNLPLFAAPPSCSLTGRATWSPCCARTP